MKILSLSVTSFGKLKSVNLDFRSGINVISNVNGFGKTTMASFIRAMLYGFTYSRTKGATDASHFAPWGSDDRFGGSMTVEHGGQVYRVERYFGKVARNEELTVTNAKTNKQINLTCSVGEYFLGLTADSYDRSAYFPQEAVEMSANDNFESRLANLVENSDVDYDKAQKSLRDYRRTLKLEKGNGGKIFELTAEQRQRERELANAVQAEKRSVAIYDRLKDIVVEKKRLTAEQAENKKRLDALKQQYAVKSLSPQDLETADKLNALEAKISRVPTEIEIDKQTLDELVNRVANLKDDVKPRIYPNFVVLAVSIVLAIAGAVLCFVLPKPVGLIVGIALAVPGIAGVIVSFVKKGAKTLPAGEKDALVSEYFSIASKYIYVADFDYNAVVKAMWKFYSDYLGDKRELETLRAVVKKPAENVDGLEKDIEQTERLIENAAARIQSLAGEAGRLEQEKRSLNFDSLTPKEQIDRLQTEIAQAKYQYQVAELTTALLTQAKDNLSSSYLPRLCKRCEELLCNVTGKPYEVAIDRLFNVQLRENGQTKTLSEFSRGTREITLLCFRVALSELLYDGAIPFVIIDDAFVNFDEENFLRATNLLKAIAEHGQVIYFTCHKRTGNLLK